MEGLLVFFFGALLSGAIGAAIGSQRGRPGAGVFWSLFLGPLGWLIVLLGPDKRPKCPECRGVIEEGARRCPHCRADLMRGRPRARVAWQNDPLGDQQSVSMGRQVQPRVSTAGPRVVTIKRRP